MDAKETKDLMDELSALLDSEDDRPLAIKPTSYATGGIAPAMPPMKVGELIADGTISASHLTPATPTAWARSKAEFEEAKARAAAAKTKGAEDLLAAMSPAVRQIVRQDAGFRLASVLQGVRDQKHAKRVGYARLQSVLSQISALKHTDDPYEGEFGSW